MLLVLISSKNVHVIGINVKSSCTCYWDLQQVKLYMLSILMSSKTVYVIGINFK